MTPTEIEKKAEDVAVDCLTAIRKCRTSGECTDRDIRQIIQLRVENTLSRAILGADADR
jgi:hypothetical protein